MIKHQDQGKQYKEEFIYAYGSGGKGSMMAELRHDDRIRKLRTHILNCKHEADKVN